jgi:hypothetical protein
MLTRLFLSVILLFTVLQAPSAWAGITVTEGDVAGVLSHTRVKLEFVYDDVKVGDMTEAAYVAKKVAEQNEKEAGVGDAWLLAWNEDRIAQYHPKFVELVNKYLGKKTDVQVSETMADPDMVMIVKVLRIEPGFYSYVVNRPAMLDLEVVLVDGADRARVLAKILVTHMPGTAVADVRTRVGESYAKAAKDLAKWLAKKGA